MHSIHFNDVENLRTKVNDQTLGIILEFIQGEGGINVISIEFANELRTLQEKYGFLVIADEIQSGVGRTGKFFGFQQYNIQPDIAVVAKAIGGGLPLGAIMGGEKVAEILTYGAHGTTFGGNPVACAAGCAVMEEIIDNGLMKQAGVIGEYLKARAVEVQKEFPAIIKEVRGKGCMLGIDIDRNGEGIVDNLRDRGFLINCTNTTVLRFLPPYIISQEQCDQLMYELRLILVSLK
jgi:acetylornithine/N-succinyldiaminopimelate aminotransferase